MGAYPAFAWKNKLAEARIRHPDFLEWRAIEGDAKLETMRRVSGWFTFLELQRPPLTRIKLREASVSFWPNHRILGIKNMLLPLPSEIYFIDGGWYLEHIDWTNEPIYRVALSAPVEIGPENVVLYVKTFLFFVRADAGSLQPIDNASDIMWCDKPKRRKYAKLYDQIVPPKIVYNEKDGIKIQCYMVFKHAIFRSSVYVSLIIQTRAGERLEPGGMVIEDDDLIEEELPMVMFGAPGPYG